MEVQNGDETHGTSITASTCNGEDMQRFQFREDKQELIWVGNIAMCVDIPGGSMEDGNTLEIWECNGTPNQQWGYDKSLGTIYAAASLVNDNQIWDVNGPVDVNTVI